MTFDYLRTLTKTEKRYLLIQAEPLAIMQNKVTKAMLSFIRKESPNLLTKNKSNAMLVKDLNIKLSQGSEKVKAIVAL